MERHIKHNTHPGEILHKEVLIPNELSIDQACELLEIAKPTLLDILSGKSSITSLAPRIATVFGGNPELWTRLQLSYELREAKQKRE